jgi:hypothetical protein
MTNRYNPLRTLSRLSALPFLPQSSIPVLAAAIITILGALIPFPASAEYIYRGLLTDNQGALDLRTARMAFNPTLSFNKDLQAIYAAPQNFRCALRMDTQNPIPNVGDTSPLRGFANFQATYDANPPAVPVGHVSVTPRPAIVMPNPAQEFANELKAEAQHNPAAFNEAHIVGVPTRDTDEDCHDRPKSFN